MVAPSWDGKRPAEMIQAPQYTVNDVTVGAPVPSMSVVSPFHNRRAFLAGVIETLGQQTFTDFELIIVDDGSSDGLADDIAGLKTDFPIRFIRLEQNRGAAAARNVGIDAARGRYVALLDSDDAWHPEKLRLQFEQLENNTSGHELVSLTRQLVRSRYAYVSPAFAMGPDDDVGSYLFLRGGVIQSSMMVLSRDLAGRVRFDKSDHGHDDWSFALRLQAAGARFAMLEQPLTIYDDTAGRTRRSPKYSIARLGWLEERRTALGERAYWAAAAAVASHLPLGSGVNPLGIIHAAYRQRSISTARAAYYVLVWAFPSVRGWARQAHQRWNIRPPGMAS
jgi:glycosyltransferase involved in cell wall biosynthesis